MPEKWAQCGATTRKSAAPRGYLQPEALTSPRLEKRAPETGKERSTWRGLPEKLTGAVSFRLAAVSQSIPAENKCPNLRLFSPHPSLTPRVE